MLYDVARKFDENQTLSNIVQHHATLCNMLRATMLHEMLHANDTCKIGTIGQPHPYTTARLIFLVHQVDLRQVVRWGSHMRRDVP